MDRRTFVAAAGASATAAALGGLSLALQACAPKRFPWPGETQAFTAKQVDVLASQLVRSKKLEPLFAVIGTQEFDGETFEIWKTPNGYVHVGPGARDMPLDEKLELVKWHDEHFLGPKAASALPA